MATVDKTWSFTSDNEGLADAGVSDMNVLHDSAGNPGGSLEFFSASGTTERAVRASTGETWETWGVPSGATVTDVEVTAWQHRKWNTGAASWTITMRVVGSGGSSVHSAGDLVSENIGSGSELSWGAGGGLTSRAVDGGSQAYNTDVRLEVQATLSVGDSGRDLGIDNITLRMTYTEGGGAPAAEKLATLGVG